MAEDTRDVIEQIQSKAHGYHGRELTPAEMATEFAKFDIGERVDALDRLNADSAPLSISEAAKRLPYERALRNAHEPLRKVGR